MLSTEKLNALFQQTRSEHVELHHRVELCVAAMARLQQGERSAHAIDQWRKSLEYLRDHLKHHFEQEEQGGWLEEAVARMPRLAHQLSILEKQHGEFLTSLDRLVNLSASTAPLRADLTAEFFRFQKELLEHEAVEEKILAEGFNESLEIE